MTIQEAARQLSTSLRAIYEEREAAAITDRVMEHITGWKKLDRITQKNTQLPEHQQAILHQHIKELLAHRPVQYVLQEAWFCGMRFYVDENVLIPRPETEELVEWMISDNRDHPWQSAAKILDIGTGSGCIAIALQKKLPHAKIYACDVSAGALEVAKRNARELHADLYWMQTDILDPQQTAMLDTFDCIVSNPPYIPSGDKHTLNRNVSGYEPHIALFAPDARPLLFYETIFGLAKEKLFPGGKLFAELHEDLADAVERLCISKGFRQVVIKKDMQGKKRMIKATMLL